uniref:Structural maintenance of chromosomes protein n=1 Tax=Leptocylindrus danicus TaxID=163516 RepID=A0A7S2JYQ7_9STRA
MMEDSAMDTDTSGTPPRLMITKMVLENFKSYAGIKEIGPFHKCFSSVVGPNGSGKSNVIDAMLFVFGKRAKKLRLNKVSELIHNSDAYRDNPLQYARVSVYFNDIVDTGVGDEDYDIVPNSEMVVSRTARRDNSSSYKLDGKNCSFKQVAEYLGSKGIDLENNRFLILQGEVEMISMMAPKGKTENDEGLLEYLEDIIGSNKYVADATEAAEKVESLNEQRQERLNRVKAVEKEKDSLEGAKLEAEGLLGKEREIRRKKNILFQINASEITRDLEKVNSHRDELVEKLEEERSKLKAASDRVAEIEAGHKEQASEYEELHRQALKTKEDFTAYERRDIKMREDIKHLKSLKKKLEAKIRKESEKAEKSSNKAIAAEESIPELEKRIEALTEGKAIEDAKLEKIYEDMKGVTEGLRLELEQKTQELAPVQQERSVFQAALDTAATEVKLLEDATTRAKEQLTAAEKELASLDETQSSKRSELSSLEDELESSKQRADEAQNEDRLLVEKEKSLAKKCSELMARTEEAKAALQLTNGRSNVVKSILSASRKGGELHRAGVLGRLGDLASIHEKYDVAVSTACGMLDHIVVETTKGAQLCLQFLRKHNLGRANFIPLEKMKKGAHDRAVETPEGAPRLFDLISPHKHDIAPALFLAIGNTLVAPDLETATRWAYEYGKRWRVVTMDGKLIETSGTMSGGGNSVRRGGMRLRNSKQGTADHIPCVNNQEDADNVEELDAQANAMQEKLKNVREKRRALANEIRDLNKRIKTLKVRIPKLSMEIASCDTTREELTKRIPELRAECVLSRDDTIKLERLNKKVEKCKLDMASCTMQASKLEAEVASIQKSILDAGGNKLKRQKKMCKNALSNLDEGNKELNEAKVAISSSRKASEKAETMVKNSESELRDNDEKLQQLTDEFKQLEEDAYAVMEAYETAKELEMAKQKELETVQKEREKLRKVQSAMKGIEVDLVAQFEDLDRQVKDNEKRAFHWEHELAKLRTAENQDDEFDASDDEMEGDNDEELLEENDRGDDNENDRDGAKGDHDGDSKSPSDIAKRLAKKGSLKIFTSSALARYNREEVKQMIKILEDERDSLAKDANMGAIAEYRKKEVDYLARVSELDEITALRNEARRAHEDLRRLRLEKFMDGFGQITLKLKEMYQMITLGGDAELELVDSLDPFSEGIVFSVRPPKKSWKNIANLSGGEKTLSSLALVFALHHYKPTPLYVMDEIDAALDFKNVSIVANYIKERTKNAQFIIISLRNNMFELADRLVGIYKTNNCTKSVTINPRQFGKSAEKSQLAKNRGLLSDKTNTVTMA